MNAARVILVTVAGPGGHVDVGVRSDATPAELADALSRVIGVGPALPVIEHRSPPRPGVPLGGRVLLDAHAGLAEAGVADGDLVLFRAAGDDPGSVTPDPDALRRGRHTVGTHLADLNAAQQTPAWPEEGRDH